MKTSKLFNTGRSRAVRLPNAWVKEVNEVDMELKKDGSILLRPREVDLWQVAEACGKMDGKIKRLPGRKSGVRVKL